MTSTSYVDVVTASIKNAPGGRLPAIGKLVGIEVDPVGMKPAEIPIAVAKMQDAVREKAEAVKPLPEKPTQDEFRRHLAELANLDNFLGAVLTTANGEISPTTTQITAEQISAGYIKGEGSVKFTLPEGMKIGKGENPVYVAGKILNAAAQARGIGRVFNERDAEFWRKNEADPSLRTVPGEEYLFTISLASLRKNREQRLDDHALGVPDGAIALAEACERLTPGNRGTLFKDADGNKIWVRGLTPGIALHSGLSSGVGVRFLGSSSFDVNSFYHIAFASRVASRNLKTA